MALTVQAVQKQYFTDLNNLYSQYPTPKLLQQAAAANTPVSIDDLQAAFGGRVALVLLFSLFHHSPLR